MSGIFGLTMTWNEIVEGAKACTWRRRTFELFRDIVMLMRDTGTGTKRIVNRLVENSCDAGEILETRVGAKAVNYTVVS
jgi:hypothetical protein